VRREAPGASEGGISARVSGAHPRGNPPGDGRSQNGARHDNHDNPKTFVSSAFALLPGAFVWGFFGI